MEQAMSGVALGLYFVFIVLAFGVRAVLHRRSTGSAGFNGIRGSVGSAEWWAGVLFVAAVALGLLAPASQLVGLLDPLLDGWPLITAGGVVAVAGIVLTVLAQQTMGTSWRIGVDPEETTGLVTTGPFAVVRNPVFSAMIIAAGGLTALAANPLALVGLITLVVAVQLQARVVEEPYLTHVHDQTYLTYARHVGRLVPGLGRLPRSRHASSRDKLDES